MNGALRAVCVTLALGALTPPARSEGLHAVGTVSPAEFATLLPPTALPGGFSYQQLLPRLLSLRISGLTSGAAGLDLAIITAPDLAIQMANEGFLHQIAPSRLPETERGLYHWRHEVFAVHFDPAVIVVRSGSLTAENPPETRIDLIRMLEQYAKRLSRRVGIVNIGIDSTSYLLATQDAQRSPMFWRLAGALGQANARIFPHAQDMMQAMVRGEIDIAYNVPLSLAVGSPAMQVVCPRDYMVVSPWTLMVPLHAGQPEQAIRLAEQILGTMGGNEVADACGFRSQSIDAPPNNVHVVPLGPELLTYLDPLKKTRFLDTWIQLVTNR